METLYQGEFTNIEGQKIRVSFFKRDARSPRDIENNEPIRYEHIIRKEILHNGQWIIVPSITNPSSEEIVEYLMFDLQDDGS